MQHIRFPKIVHRDEMGLRWIAVFYASVSSVMATVIQFLRLAASLLMLLHPTPDLSHVSLLFRFRLVVAVAPASQLLDFQVTAELIF